MSSRNQAKQLAILLKNARLAIGLSQAQAARNLNRLQSYVSRCESGIRRVDIFELEQFARVYKTRMSFFLREEDSASSPRELLLIKTK